MTPRPPRPPPGHGPPAADRYDPLSVALHWLLAALVAALAPLGIVLAGLPFPSAAYDRVHLWHRSLGEIAFLAVLLLLAWRRLRPPVRPLADAPWRMRTAALVHGLMLALLVLVPLAKLVRGAFGLGWSFFGLDWPAPWPPAPPVTRLLGRAHDLAAFALLALSALHVAAALWRQFARREPMLRRMG